MFTLSVTDKKIQFSLDIWCTKFLEIDTLVVDQHNWAANLGQKTMLHVASKLHCQSHIHTNLA